MRINSTKQVVFNIIIVPSLPKQALKLGNIAAVDKVTDIGICWWLTQKSIVTDTSGVSSSNFQLYPWYFTLHHMYSR